MPRAKKQAAPDSLPLQLQPRALPADAQWGGFINIRLSDEEKETAQLWIREHEREAFAMFADNLGEGFKFSLSYDAENQSYIASYTGAGWVGSELRCSMSARAGTWFEALALLVWKHNIHASGNWGQYRTDGRKVPSFG